MIGYQTLVKVSAILMMSVMIVGLLVYYFGLRMNTTQSIPVGLYRISGEPYQKGDYVMFCPPDKPIFKEAMQRGYIGLGFCPGGYGYLMKKVMAIAGDVISINQSGVYVNDKRLPLSQPLLKDGWGWLMGVHRLNQYRLDEQSVLLMSDISRLSFDGRYFGPISKDQIKAVVRLIWTW